MSLKLGTTSMSSARLGTTAVNKIMLGTTEVWSAFTWDTDALTYFAAITTAGSSISANNKLAVDTFIKGCKADGIWTAIKASCLLAGPDSLAGALVPLVGTAPTNNGFVAGDYSRTTGLVGNGSSKYINANRNHNADPQNSYHQAVYVTTSQLLDTFGKFYIGSYVAGSGMSNIFTDSASPGKTGCRNRQGAIQRPVSTSNNTGLIATNRSTSANYTLRTAGTNYVINDVSQAPVSADTHVFQAANLSGYTSNGRLSFYSIGVSIDLSKLDARLTTYMASLT